MAIGNETVLSFVLILLVYSTRSRPRIRETIDIVTPPKYVIDYG